jgi:tetratricopeptide (TPR) repeat protein
VADEARRLVGEQPLRERLWEQLMAALAGCGRRSEALDVYLQARRVLVAELGLEPGPRLRELQRAVIDGEEGGADATSLGPYPPVGNQAARDTSGVVPAQLPADIPAFDMGEELIVTEATFGLATAHLRAGNRDWALAHARAAVAAAAAGGYRVVEGQALTALAAVYLDGGRLELAQECASRAVGVNRETGHALGQARAHLIAERAMRRVGRAVDARRHRRSATSLFAQIGVSADVHIELLSLRAAGGRGRAPRGR